MDTEVEEKVYANCGQIDFGNDAYENENIFIKKVWKLCLIPAR